MLLLFVPGVLSEYRSDQRVPSASEVNVEYKSEPFPTDADDRHRGKFRVTSVEGEVIRRRNSIRTNTPDPPIGSMDTYLRDHPFLRSIGMEKGHIFGLNIGGDDNVSQNIVPMFSHFNQVVYKGIENDIYKDGNIIRLKIKIEYRDDEDKAIPSKIWLYVKTAKNKSIDHSELSFTYLTSLEMANPVASPYPFQQEIRQAVAAHLPAEKPDFEPYAFLENVPGFREAESTTNFSTKQREYILTANALYTFQSKGTYFLTSDDSEDSYPTLNCQGGKDRPHIDHVVPKSLGGSNHFRNARVTSSRQNMIKGNSLPEESKAVLRAISRRNQGRRAKVETDYSDNRARPGQKRKR